jgi:hypothetical protein
MRCCPTSKAGRTGVVLAFAFVTYAASAQSTAPADPAPGANRLARLVALGRLWGEIKYFHPYLAYRPIDWDSAFVAAYPRVGEPSISAPLGASQRE